MSITICDSIMGSGKTSAAINYIINHRKINRREMSFVFITPYLQEVDRILNSCDIEIIQGEEWGDVPTYIKNQINFFQPEDKKGSKLQGLKNLLKEKRNVVTTHSLFSLFDSEVFELIEAGEYTLFIDESPSVIELYNNKVTKENRITADDCNLLLDKLITKDDSHILKWNDKNYNGRFNDIKKLCELEALGVYDNTLIWMQPIHSFTCFKDIFVLTYMFEGQLLKYYFDINRIEYKYCIAEKMGEAFQFREVDKPHKSSIDKTLIDIYDGNLNKIGEKEDNKNNRVDGTLSSSWYKNASKIELKNIKKHLRNYLRNTINAKSEDIIWTCYKDYESDLKDYGFAKSFIPCTTNATNEYKDCSTVAYMINFFANPNIVNFFSQYKIKVDEDKYSLSMLLQFIWRSRIRENKPINLYIPSKRMRELLIDWLEQ